MYYGIPTIALYGKALSSYSKYINNNKNSKSIQPLIAWVVCLQSYTIHSMCDPLLVLALNPYRPQLFSGTPDQSVCA